jgi:hypothetical protein
MDRLLSILGLEPDTWQVDADDDDASSIPGYETRSALLLCVMQATQIIWPGRINQDASLCRNYGLVPEGRNSFDGLYVDFPFKGTRAQFRANGAISRFKRFVLAMASPSGYKIEVGCQLNEVDGLLIVKCSFTNDNTPPPKFDTFDWPPPGTTIH